MASIILSRTCLRAAVVSSNRNAVQAARFKSSKNRPAAASSSKPTPEETPNPNATNPQSQQSPLQSEATPPVTQDRVSPASLSLDITPSQVNPSQMGRTGAKSSKDSLSTIEKRRKAMGRVAFGMLGLGVAFGIFWLGREWEDYEKAGKGKETLEAGRWGRTQARLGETTDIFSKPQWKELLPPPLPPPHQKPYTLLLSMDDLLITSVWDRNQGWRTAKRPGVDYFIGYLSQFYEVVIFTTQPYYTALPVIDQIDPYRFFLTYHLFRESTRVVDGKIAKDLSYLNRDLSKVIILDTHEDHVFTHRENAIVMEPWKGGGNGSGLVGMIPFLESIAFFHPADVRPILTAYKDKDIGLEYAKHEQREKQKFLEEWRKSGGTKKGASNLSFTGLFSGSASRHTGPEPLTFLELKRREAQGFYLQEQEFIKEHEPVLEKQRQEDLEKQREMAGSLMGWIESLGGKKPEDEKQKSQFSDKPLPAVDASPAPAATP